MPKLPPLPPLTSIQPGAYIRLLVLATAGGVATLFGIGLAIEPQGLEKDPGPYQLSLPDAPTGTSVAFHTAGIKALGHDPVHLRSVTVDALPSGLTAPQIVTEPLGDGAADGAGVVNTSFLGSTVETTTIKPGETWALVVSLKTGSPGDYEVHGLTVDYDVAGHHKTRHYAMDVSLTATS